MLKKIKIATAVSIIGITNASYCQTIKSPGFSAEINSKLSHDDNIYRVLDELAESDNFAVISPDLTAIAAYGKHRAVLNYKGEFANYSNFKEANFYDHDISGLIRLEHSNKLSTRFEFEYIRDHEDPGSINRIQLNLQEYNKYQQDSASVGLGYGREDATGKFNFEFSRSNKNYLNNDLDFLDYQRDNIFAQFLYRVAPRTQIYVEANLSDYTYDNESGNSLDNTYNRYLAGVAWDFTNKLSGDVSVGYQERDYESENLRDINGLAYSVEVEWSINTYTKLKADARRETIDSSLENTGGFLRTSYGIGFSHELTERSKLKIDAGYSTDEIVFISSSDREDKRYAYQASYEYDVLKNLIIGVSYTYEERESTEETAVFEANIVQLTIEYNLEG